jgi:hypothetical protein
VVSTTIAPREQACIAGVLRRNKIKQQENGPDHRSALLSTPINSGRADFFKKKGLPQFRICEDERLIEKTRTYNVRYRQTMGNENAEKSGSSTPAPTGGSKKNQKKGKPGFSAPRSSEGTGIEELRGFVFTFGVPGQQARYAKTKKAIAEYIGMTSDCGQDL